MKDFYKELDVALSDYEQHKPYKRYHIDWITDKIDWCWKFKKINSAQLSELTSRVCEIINKPQ